MDRFPLNTPRAVLRCGVAAHLLTRFSRILAMLLPMSLLATGIVFARDLSFDERVAAQEAIERVYWEHRIWPAENQAPKPALAEVLSTAQLRARVDDYLRKSSALAAIWNRPITAEQLQGEMRRMADTSRAPVVLRELFAALGDDPFVIAETLARQTLADRLIREAYAGDDRLGTRGRGPSVLDTTPRRDPARAASGGIAPSPLDVDQPEDSSSGSARERPQVLFLEPSRRLRGAPAN